MEQRRKIIIPTGSEPDESLSSPHFDAEATLSARPVVPLAEPVAQDAQAARQSQYSPYPSPRGGTAAWKRSTIILIALFAVGIGVVSGLAIGIYQSRKITSTASPVVAAPAADEQPQATTAQPQPEPKQSPRVTEQPEEETAKMETEAPVAASLPDKEPDKKVSTDDDDRDDKRASRDDARHDEGRRVPPAVVTREPADEPIMDERDERRARRDERWEQRREERRRRRVEDDDDGPARVPRHIERARQEINRIRDIFEGRQP